MKHTTLRRRILSGLLAAVLLLTLAPLSLAAETYYICPACKQQTATLTVVKEANCHEEGVNEYFCHNVNCSRYYQSYLEKTSIDPNNHDATYRDNGDGTHSGVCTFHISHNTDVHIEREKHAFSTSGGVCTKCLAVDYSNIQLSLPESMDLFISLNDVNAKLTVGDVSISTGTADLTGEYTVTYNWYYKGAQVGSGKSFTPPAEVISKEGVYQYACFVMAVPKDSAALKILSATCTVNVRVEDLITAYATIGSSEEYMDFSETNSRTPMSVEDQIYEAVYNQTNSQPSYVVFMDKPAASAVGDMEVIPGRRYYFYSPSIGTNNRLSGVTFTPNNKGATGSYVIYFTAYDEAGLEYPGVLTVVVEKYAGNMDVLLTASKGEIVPLEGAQFEAFWRSAYPQGTLTRVNFTRLPAGGEGTLYIGYSAASRNGTRVKSGDYFYAQPYGSQYGLDEVSFVPREGFTGYVAVPFEAFGENNRGNKTTRNGTMYIFISDSSIADVTCKVEAGSSCRLKEEDFLKVFQAAGGTGNGFYIQLLEVPASGALYTGYTNDGKGVLLTTASISARPFYYSSSWGGLISDLTYVPGLAKSESVRYVAYDLQGRPVHSGSILFSVLEAAVVAYTSPVGGVTFQTKDFTSFNGARVSNISFTPPPAASGTLYYDRTASSAGTAITSEGPRFYLTAPNNTANVLLLSKVTFVPAVGFKGTVDIPFTAYDESGGKLTGTVRVNVPTAPAEIPDTTPDPTPDQDPIPVTVTFKDVPNDKDTAWYYTAVTELATAGILGGFEDNTFRPSEAVTYGQALKMIMKAAGYDEIAPTGSHWASGYLDRAVADGLTSATIGQMDKRIDRYTIAAIAARALKLPLPSTNTSPFYDMDMNEATALYVLSLYETGIIKGSEDKEGHVVYNGEYAIRRNEMAVIIWRMYNYKSTGRAES